jgi:hypothetical protein
MSRKIHLLLGKALMLHGQPAQALSEFMKMRPNGEGEKSELSMLVSQCRYAMDLMKVPSQVKVMQPPADINTAFPEYAAFIMPVSHSILFTSRRQSNTGSVRDENDHLFTEDIYRSVWNRRNESYAKPENMKISVNTEQHEACLGFTPDEKSIILYKNSGGGDIYLATLVNDTSWSDPVPMSKEINSSYFETSACFADEGKSVYFISERPGGFGQGDIYMSVRDSNGAWGKAENLGLDINTAGDEISVSVSEDGETLYFSSNGHPAMGGYDIFRSELKDGKWTTPVNMGYPVNTTGDDLHFHMLKGGRYAFSSSVRPEGKGRRDIWMIDFQPYAPSAGNPAIPSDISR